MLTVAASIGSVTISDVYNGEDKLTRSTDYTMVGGKVTLKKAYLESLDEGDHFIIFETDVGEGSALVQVVDTSED